MAGLPSPTRVCYSMIKVALGQCWINHCYHRSSLAAPAARAPDQLKMFTALFWCLSFEKTFTNHKFRVGLHVTFGLNDRRIPIQYPSWLARGFGEDIELLIARIHILSITAGCRLFVAHNSQGRVTTLPRPHSRLGRGWNWAVDSQEIIKNFATIDVRFKGQNAPKSISAGALLQTHWGSSQRSPDP